MVPFVFLAVLPLQNAEGLDNHLGSCPGCLDELGISCASNWAATLKLPSITTSSKAINNHLFCVKTNAKLATNHLVEVMWYDKYAFDTESCICLTLLSNASNVPPLPPLEEPAGNSSILIEHGYRGTKQINMTIDEHAASGLLKNLLLDKLYAPPTLDAVV
jgi:hypothetical protein